MPVPPPPGPHWPPGLPLKPPWDWEPGFGAPHLRHDIRDAKQCSLHSLFGHIQSPGFPPSGVTMVPLSNSLAGGAYVALALNGFGWPQLKHAILEAKTFLKQEGHSQSPGRAPETPPGLVVPQLKQVLLYANTFFWQFGHVQSPSRLLAMAGAAPSAPASSLFSSASRERERERAPGSADRLRSRPCSSSPSPTPARAYPVVVIAGCWGSIG